MNRKSLMFDLQADQLASVKIATKIISDEKCLDENKALFENIIGELGAKVNTNRSKFVQLTIGGDIVTLNCNTIEHHVGENYLFALLSYKYCYLLPKDKNGRVFLDLDVRWVEPQFNWLRDMAMWNGDEKSIPKISGVHPVMTGGHEIISHYFQSQQLLTVQTGSDWLSANSDILRDLPASNEAMRTMIHSDSNCVLTAKLLYRSSRDGLTAASFHKQCDGHKNTLCVIRDTDGGIFGGFTGDVAWKTAAVSGCYFEFVKAPNAFLFLLSKSNVFKPVKCKAKSDCFLRCTSDTRILCGFGNNISSSSSDLLVFADADFHWNGLGNAFECGNKSDFVNGKVSKLEIFEICSASHDELPVQTPPHQSVPVTTTDVLSSLLNNNLPFEYSQLMQHRWDVNMQIQEAIRSIRSEMQQLRDQAVSVLNELIFVAKFVGFALPAVVHKDEEDSLSDMSELEKTLNEIQTIVKLLTVNRAETKSGGVVSSDASSIVYINAGGRKIATTKATLLQAPSGSILANMASDVWGHDLDSEGNIFQDVNPDLFTAIINHLRLKALLPASEVPPITVYAEQSAALDNLLAFYMLTDIPVEEITESPPPVKRLRIK